MTPLWLRAERGWRYERGAAISQSAAAGGALQKDEEIVWLLRGVTV